MDWLVVLLWDLSLLQFLIYFFYGDTMCRLEITSFIRFSLLIFGIVSTINKNNRSLGLWGLGLGLYLGLLRSSYVYFGLDDFSFSINTFLKRSTKDISNYPSCFFIVL